MSIKLSKTETTLRALAAERILLLDGGMGTMLQQRRFDEAAFRNTRFKDWQRDVRGNNDLLDADAARRRARNPSRLFSGRRRHRLDQHLLLDRDRAGRLRHGRRWSRN